MGRTASPKKPTPAARSLSSRLAPSFTPAAPSPLRSASSAAASAPASAAASPAHAESPSMPAQKRALDDVADPSTPAGGAKKAKRKARGRKAKREAKAAGGAEDVEEGEVVEGDFSDLFMVDTTPAAVKAENRFVDTPGKRSGVDEDGDAKVDDLTSLPLSGAKAGQAVADPDEEEEEEEDELDENEALRLFAKEVALTEDEDSDDSDGSSDEEDGQAEALMLYDDEEGLKQAIKGKIVDDSSAPVTGRYYKEADLTKTCVLCGEHGHTSRDCTHQQCFICGAIDEHEARNCPVALDCDVASGSRSSYGTRCSLCQSSNHMSANCPTLWRIYDTSGPKPPKRKPVLACANCGSTKDHFIDDCLLPRGHPMRYVDPSAFNRAALGNVSLPSYSAAPSASRRRGAPSASSASKQRSFDDDAGDDDWFASRARSGGGGSAAGKGGRGQPPPPAYKPSRAQGGGWGSNGAGGSGQKKGQHLHFGGFSDESRNRLQHFQEPSPAHSSRSSGSSYREREYSYDPRDSRSGGGRGGGGGRGSGYDSPRDDYRSMYGSQSSNSGGGGRRGGNGNGGGNGGGSRGGRQPPSLLDRVGGDSGGGKGGRRPGPAYKGGYA
ncbi:hypothetical protein JCM10213v2_000237 [Rhodosporidiobolus nylandii]